MHGLKKNIRRVARLTLILATFTSSHAIARTGTSEPTSQTTVQQSRKISGIITDSKGESIIGANVSVKGTTNGTITDIDGRFTLEAPVNATLMVSYVGYTTMEIPTGNRTLVNVTMAETTQNIDEVVVVGYGVQRKADVTTAISSVGADALKDRPSVNFGQALAGQMAGVQVQQTNGAPGGEGLNVRIRGAGSITQSNNPLYVVDGYPMEDGAFRLINPSDIENIQVLKDASSTAIYGSRGANGVVIITTKKGKSGAPVVNVNVFAGFQQPERKIKMMNRDQYVQWFIDGRNQSWLDAAVIAADPNKSPHSINDSNERRRLYSSSSTLYEIPDGKGNYKYNFLDPQSVAMLPDNNWQDLLFRNALMQQYELSVSGGGESSLYNIGASYVKQDGIVRSTDYERLNFRTNLSSKISKTVEVGMNLSAYYSTGREQANGKDAPIMYSLCLPPIFPQRNEDGSWGSMVRNPEIFPGDVANPIAIADELYRRRTRYGFVGSMFGEWEILKGLKYRLNISGSAQDNQYKFYQPSYVDLDASKAPRPAQGRNERGTTYDWLIENTLTYNKTFAEKHALTAMVGYTTQSNFYTYLNGEARGFPNDKIMTLNAGTMYGLDNKESQYSMISYLARVNYAYADKYLLTATLRSDGSSRFGADNKWGTFPSASVGWRMTEEPFMQGVKRIINDLKIRGSFGIAGNNRIGNYSSIGLLSTGYYPTGDGLQNMVGPNTMSNPGLGWEKTRQIDIGFDLSAFDSRLRFEFDWYDSQSIDLLLSVPMPTITGYTSQMQNVGKVQNRGVEFLLSGKILTGPVSWSSSYNMSFNRNKVLEVGPDGRPIYGSAPNADNSFITTVGQPIGTFYGYVYEGVFMSQEELDSRPHLPTDKVGDGKYKNVKEDNVLDSNDRDFIGNNQPLFTAGWSNEFSYKNWNLNFQFTGSYGGKLFSFYKRMVGIYHGDRNGMIEQEGRWRSTEEPGDGWHFRPTRNPVGWQRTPSSAWVQDGSFLRLRNLTLGYTFDKKLIEKLRMKGLRLYVTGENLFTITNYVGYDPETSSQGDSGDNRTAGGDYLGYPAARSFILGANITF